MPKPDNDKAAEDLFPPKKRAQGIRTTEQAITEAANQITAAMAALTAVEEKILAILQWWPTKTCFPAGAPPATVDPQTWRGPQIPIPTDPHYPQVWCSSQTPIDYD
jgi:hypothetical protein